MLFIIHYNNIITMFEACDTYKRNRSKNFLQREVIVLLDLIEQYKMILHSKRTDKTAIIEKRHAWKSIEQEFNNTPGMIHFRDSKTLYLKYENLKKAAKMRLGPHLKDVKSSEDEQLHCTLPGSLNSIDSKLELLGQDVKVQEIPLGFEASTILCIEEDSGKQELDIDKTLESCSLVNLKSLPEAFEEKDIESSDHHYAISDKQNSLAEIDTDTVHICSDVDMVYASPEKAQSSSPTCFCTFQAAPNLSRRVNTTTLAEKKTNSFCSSGGTKANRLQDNMGSAKKLQTTSWSYKSRFPSSLPNMRKRKGLQLEDTLPGKRIENQSKKKDILNLQERLLNQQLISLQVEEHKLKLKCMQERHELEMKLLKLKVQNEELVVQKHLSELKSHPS